jgi:hypothetical protein
LCNAINTLYVLIATVNCVCPRHDVYVKTSRIHILKQCYFNQINQMKSRTCLGLSKYDMNTCLYYILTVLLCLTVNGFIQWHDYHSIYITPFLVVVFHTFSNFAMYLLGFLAGIIIARSTALENLESLTEIKLDPAAKPGAVGSINTPHSII